MHLRLPMEDAPRQSRGASVIKAGSLLRSQLRPWQPIRIRKCSLSGAIR